jgi:hypothetical protein
VPHLVVRIQQRLVVTLQSILLVQLAATQVWGHGHDMSTLQVATILSNTANIPPVFQDSAGTQIGTLCRAWVNFNGQGTVAIRAAFNVSSITDHGVGDYTLNFTTAMTDADYCVSGSAGSQIAQLIMSPYSPAQMLTTSCRVFISNTAGAGDNNIVCVAIFR